MRTGSGGGASDGMVNRPAANASAAANVAATFSSGVAAARQRRAASNSVPVICESAGVASVARVRECRSDVDHVRRASCVRFATYVAPTGRATGNRPLSLYFDEATFLLCAAPCYRSREVAPRAGVAESRPWMACGPDSGQEALMEGRSHTRPGRRCLPEPSNTQTTCASARRPDIRSRLKPLLQELGDRGRDRGQIPTAGLAVHAGLFHPPG